MLNVEEGVNCKSEDILGVVERAKGIVSDLDTEKIDLTGSRIYPLIGVRVEIVPVDEKAMSVYICIRALDDIVVGILHGAHEHFNQSHPGTEIVEKALDFFKSLLNSKQIINLKKKGEKVFSKEILFKLNDELISEYSDKELLLNVFGSVISESFEFSFK